MISSVIRAAATDRVMDLAPSRALCTVSASRAETAPASPSKHRKKANLATLSSDELRRDLEVVLGIKEKFRSEQIWNWVYNRGVTKFDSMLQIGKPLRESLTNAYDIDFGEVTKDTLSEDGTRKILVSFGGQEVESVFIPEVDRGTICVSSQIGCTYACKFCHTGTQPILRNLQAGEIVAQVMQIKRLLFDFPAKDNRVLTNIVFMGQGEPFYNYRNLTKAIETLTSSAGLAYSKRRITVSTSGVVPKIRQLGQEHPQVGLAISLHAVTNELRSRIVTANNQWPLEELLDACKSYGGLAPTRRITFEYVMLKGVNDSDAEARELVRLLKDFPSLVNLIPFNPWPGSEFEASSNNRIHRFSQIIEEGGVAAPIRWPRGRDILAACGQLKTETARVAKPLPPAPE